MSSDDDNANVEKTDWPSFLLRPNTETLIIGDSIVKGLHENKMSVENEHAQVISIPGMGHKKLLEKLKALTPVKTVTTVVLHVGIIDCTKGYKIGMKAWCGVIQQLHYSFPNAVIKMSSILPYNQHNPHIASCIHDTNRSMEEACKQQPDVDFINNDNAFYTRAGDLKTGWMKDAIHVNERGASGLAIQIKRHYSTRNGFRGDNGAHEASWQYKESSGHIQQSNTHTAKRNVYSRAWQEHGGSRSMQYPDHYQRKQTHHVTAPLKPVHFPLYSSVVKGATQQSSLHPERNPMAASQAKERTDTPRTNTTPLIRHFQQFQQQRISLDESRQRQQILLSEEYQPRSYNRFVGWERQYHPRRLNHNRGYNFAANPHHFDNYYKGWYSRAGGYNRWTGYRGDDFHDDGYRGVEFRGERYRF
jgi:hypothetical protein